jgi:acyl-coenzyme A thioesterase PaaI-like protein
MDLERSLQDQFAPNLICFGCGPANEKGLQIKSFVRLGVGNEFDDGGNKVVAAFTPSPHHRAFEGMINGGIIGSLLDCHLNWTAAWHLMGRNQVETPPCCVTAKYEVTFLAPTPAGQELELEAWVVDSSDRKAVVHGTLGVPGEASVVTAKCTGTFVAVKPGHPAYHRW